MTQLALSDVGVEFGATTLFSGVTFTVAQGERWGVIGRNGSGKTTLFRLLTGQMQPSAGQIARQPGLRVTLLEQHRDFGDAATVWDAVAGGLAELRALEASLAVQAAALEHDHSEAAMERYGRDLERFERDGGYTYHARVDQVLEGLGFDPEQSKVRGVDKLSGGERGRVGLARQLVLAGDVLLLDEPTNHLDLETARWLESYLRNTDRTVILVSHDRAFLSGVVDHVLHVEARTMTPYAGTYEHFVAQRTERRLVQQRQFDKQSRTIAAQEDYIRRNLAGQNTKQAKGRRKLLARTPRLSPPPGEDDVMALRLEVAARGGDQVVVADRATLAVPLAGSAERRTLIRDFTARLTRGEVVGFVGPNGAGKSTLLKAVMGERDPLVAGSLRVGDSIQAAHYRQDMTQVPLGKTLYDVIQDLRPTWERRLVQGHLGRFGFSGDEVLRKADTLSGGERARVALAMMMLSRANLLILDEPTNHLDVESIEALEDALDGYEGTVLLVSHDRAMLRALATQVWALHDGRVHVFEEPFDEWEANGGEDAMAAHAARRAALDAGAAERSRAEEEAARARREEERAARAREAEQQARRADGDARRAGDRDARKLQREAERRAERAERRAGELEAQAAALQRELGDPALYASPDGVRRAGELSKRLDAARAELERAMGEWAAAEEAAAAAARA